MYYTDGFRDEDAEKFILDVFNLLNGVVNPDNLVRGVRFYDKLEEVSLGFIVLHGPDGSGNNQFSENTNYILVGSSNVREFIASYGRDEAYVYFIDFVVHELFHATQKIDLPRYATDKEYEDMVETDCEYNATLFIYNYFDWIRDHLKLPFELKFVLSEKFHNIHKARNNEIYANMVNDPWMIKM